MGTPIRDLILRVLTGMKRLEDKMDGLQSNYLWRNLHRRERGDVQKRKRFSIPPDARCDFGPASLQGFAAPGLCSDLTVFTFTSAPQKPQRVFGVPVTRHVLSLKPHARVHLYFVVVSSPPCGGSLSVKDSDGMALSSLY